MFLSMKFPKGFPADPGFDSVLSSFSHQKWDKLLNLKIVFTAGFAGLTARGESTTGVQKQQNLKCNLHELDDSTIIFATNQHGT